MIKKVLDVNGKMSVRDQQIKMVDIYGNDPSFNVYNMVCKHCKLHSVNCECEEFEN